jgi:hypothetical protein
MHNLTPLPAAATLAADFDPGTTVAVHKTVNQRLVVAALRWALFVGCSSALACDGRNHIPAAPADPAPTANAAIIEATRGQVLRVEGSRFIVVAAGDMLEGDQIIETSTDGGAASLRLADGRRVTLGPGARWSLREDGKRGGTLPAPALPTR